MSDDICIHILVNFLTAINCTTLQILNGTPSTDLTVYQTAVNATCQEGFVFNGTRNQTVILQCIEVDECDEDDDQCTTQSDIPLWNSTMNLTCQRKITLNNVEWI